MADQWYYTQNDERQGPVTPEELKELVNSGQLKPHDLIWKKGMPNWVPAQTIKGLTFPASETPPPIPVPPVSQQVEAPLRFLNADSPVRTTAALSFPQAVQETQPCGEEPFDVAMLGSGTARPFARTTQARLKKAWAKPVGISAGCLVALIVLALVVGSRDSPNVALVKAGHLAAYPHVPVGKAIDSFLSSPRWEATSGHDGNEYVNVRGGAQLLGKPVQVALQFRVDPKAGSFEINALEVNDIPQNGFVKLGLLTKIFKDYKP